MAKENNAAEKKAAPVKAETKKAPAKAAAPKKAVAKRNLNKGQTVECEVCGLAVTVTEIGGVAIEEDDVLLCCGKPMKAKAKGAAKAKTAARK